MEYTIKILKGFDKNNNEINFSLGSNYFIIGENNIGKSTILNMLDRNDHPKMNLEIPYVIEGVISKKEFINFMTNKFKEGYRQEIKSMIIQKTSKMNEKINFVVDCPNNNKSKIIFKDNLDSLIKQVLNLGNKLRKNNMMNNKINLYHLLESKRKELWDLILSQKKLIKTEIKNIETIHFKDIDDYYSLEQKMKNAKKNINILEKLEKLYEENHLNDLLNKTFEKGNYFFTNEEFHFSDMGISGWKIIKKNMESIKSIISRIRKIIFDNGENINLSSWKEDFIFRHDFFPSFHNYNENEYVHSNTKKILNLINSYRINKKHILKINNKILKKYNIELVLVNNADENNHFEYSFILNDNFNISDGIYTLIKNYILNSFNRSKSVVMLHDEPSNSLDYINTKELSNMFKEEKNTNFIATHNFDLINKYTYENTYVIYWDSKQKTKRIIKKLSDISKFEFRNMEDSKNNIIELLDHSVFSYCKMVKNKNILFVEGMTDKKVYEYLFDYFKIEQNFEIIQTFGVWQMKIFFSLFESQKNVKFISDRDDAAKNSLGNMYKKKTNLNHIFYSEEDIELEDWFLKKSSYNKIHLYKDKNILKIIQSKTINEKKELKLKINKLNSNFS